MQETQVQFLGREDSPAEGNGYLLQLLSIALEQHHLLGLMLKLKLQYSGHPMQRANSLEKTLKLGKIEGRRRRE